MPVPVWRNLMAAVALVLTISTASTSAHAIGVFDPKLFQPSILAMIDGKAIELPLLVEFDRESGTFSFTLPEPVGTENIIRNLTGSTNPDPTVAYVVGVVDGGAPSTFAFTFSTPIATPGQYNSPISALAGAVIDAGTNGATVTPTLGPTPVFQVSTTLPGPVNLGVDIGSPACSAPPGLANSCGPYSATSTVTVHDPASLNVDLGFSLTGGGDAAGFVGRTDITAVPEPSTMLLFGTCVVAGVAAAWRRSRSPLTSNRPD